MTNYVYIQNLFSEILAQSKAIQGRFYIGHRYGLQDINYDTLGQAITETLPDSKKWPLAIMAPPHSTGDKDGWEEFRIITFFMKQSEIENINADNSMAMHTILEDWHDMKRVAINFLNAIWNVQDSIKPTPFVVPKHKWLCIPISLVGADKVSGVRLDFDFRLFTGCALEDYIDDYPSNLIIELDGHVEHQL